MTRFRLWVIGFLIASIAASGLGGYAIYKNDLLGSRAQSIKNQPIPSRRALEYLENVIKQKKPAPPEAAREYAYVASIYSDVVQQVDQSNALTAVQKMIEILYPDQNGHTASVFKDIASATTITPATTLSKTAHDLLNAYQHRNQTDGHDKTWDGIIPTGVDKWVPDKGKQPLSPEAGQWQRWEVNGNFNVPAPPVYGSAEDLQQLSIIRNAVQNRTGADIATINFWGGTPGTVTPAGIWQDQLFNNVKDSLPFDPKQRDVTYASVQFLLAQTLADAFMECWKVKYTYWTARPSQRIANLSLAMANPSFPSYISGHSTISKAAAEVLAVTVPAKASAWRQMAVDARDSRLVAGIHFDIDNSVGFQLGSDIAAQIINNRHLSPLIN